MENRTARSGVIDFWRLVFALLILLHHSYHLADVPDPLFKGGIIGVEFFLLVSGFLMVRSAEREEEGSIGRRTNRFLRRKYLRLLPTVLLGWALAMGITAALCRSGLRTLALDAIQSLWQLLSVYHYGIDGFVYNWPLWYLFALLTAQLALYPLLLKNRDGFLYILAPLLAILCYGYLYKNFMTLRPAGRWLDLCYLGLVRAVAGVCLGAVCFRLCAALSRLRFTPLARGLLTAVELGCYLIVVLALAVSISFSSQSYCARLIPPRLGQWLGRFSFALYLSHMCWAANLSKVLPGLGYGQLVPLYLLASAATALVLLGLEGLCRRFGPALLNRLRRSCLAETNTQEL